MKKNEIKKYSNKFLFEHYTSDLVKILLSANFGLYFLAKKIVLKNKAKEAKKKILKNLGLDKSKKKAIKLGYIVKKHYHDIKRTGKKNNIEEEVYLSEDDLRQHIQVVGTTGSGKTVWLKAIIEQQIARGGGAFVVFGKADNKMLQQIHYAMAKYNREQDLFIIDWTATPEDLKLQKKKYNKDVITNSINLFELGDEEAVLGTFIKIAKINDKDSWGQSAKSLLQELIKFLYKLNELGLTFDIEKIDLILNNDNKFKAIKEFKESLNYYFLREMITDKRAIFKLLAIFKSLYEESKEEIIESLKIKGIKYKYLFDEKYRIDKDLIAVLKQQVKDDVDNIINEIQTKKNALIIDKIEEKAGNKQSPFYKLDVSISQFNKILSFYSKFSLVLKNKESDIDLIDAIKTNKIIVFNLPGQDEESAQDISEFFISLIETLIKKRGKQEAFYLTYLLILDEINSWAARNEGKIGIGNILSVVRGLGIGVILAYQSDLGGLDKEKKELEQINANINTTILLKTQSTAIREFFNKKVQKKVVAIKEEKLNKNIKKDSSQMGVNFEEKEFFQEGMLENLSGGEGFIVKNGYAYNFLTEYKGEKRFYQKDDEAIDLAKTVDLKQIAKII